MVLSKTGKSNEANGITLQPAGLFCGVANLPMKEQESMKTSHQEQI
jgi:hypothetical protein